MYVHESLTSQEVLDILAPAVTIGEADFPEIMKGWPPLQADWHEGANQGSRLYEIDLDGQTIVGYHQEDDNKVVHRFASFADAMAGIEIQGETEVAEDDSNDVFEDMPAALVLRLPKKQEADWVGQVLKMLNDQSGDEALEVRWRDQSVVINNANLTKAQQVPAMVGGASLFIEE